MKGKWKNLVISFPEFYNQVAGRRFLDHRYQVGKDGAGSSWPDGDCMQIVSEPFAVQQIFIRVHLKVPSVFAHVTGQHVSLPRITLDGAESGNMKMIFIYFNFFVTIDSA